MLLAAPVGDAAARLAAALLALLRPRPLRCHVALRCGMERVEARGNPDGGVRVQRGVPALKRMQTAGNQQAISRLSAGYQQAISRQSRLIKGTQGHSRHVGRGVPLLLRRERPLLPIRARNRLGLGEGVAARQSEPREARPHLHSRAIKGMHSRAIKGM